MGPSDVAHYARPQTLSEALALLAEERWTVLAGGTDFYPARGVRPIRENVLDIKGVAELDELAETGTHVRLGANLSWTAIRAAALPPAFDALRAAAREVGSIQIQNRATLGGNLCNASPAADGVPPLLVLDTEVELASVRGVRRLPLGEFLQGNRKTQRMADELLTAVLVPKGSVAGRSSFRKLGGRRYLVISIAMVAVRLVVEDGRIAQASIAVGACSAVAQRLALLEDALRGAAVHDAASLVRPEHCVPLAPIDDVRATASYRNEAAVEMVRRTIASAWGGSCAAEAA